MNEIFGLSMTYFAIGCVIVTALILAFIGWIAVRNPVMFKMGLRNIPRRKTQTSLIIIGLMLSTLIITAAFGTGDTMTNSVTREVYTILGPVDEIIEWDTDKNPAPEDDQVIPLEFVGTLQQRFAGHPDIKAFIPFLAESMPVQDVRTRLNEANPRLTATRPEDVAAFGGLRDLDGNPVELAPDEIALNTDLAEKIDAVAGDEVNIFYQGQPVLLKVKAIVPNTLFGGANDTVAREGAALNFDFLASLVGREGEADFVAVTNTGTERGGLDATERVKAALEGELAGTPYKVEPVKQDQLDFAELLGNVFTSVFILFGLFSIAAGVLLIFLIFVMLAAERKPEMGMARAVGAKRRQIVESFLAEGMGYDIGAAVVGMFAGIGVAATMVWFVTTRIGEDLGLDLVFDVSVRSLAVAFCLGIIVTFIVVFFASWRASRLNIVAAIRDLPETKQTDPEGATWHGYVRSALNGFAGFGFLVVSLFLALRLPDLFTIFLLGAFVGAIGMWVPMLRNSNHGAPAARRREGESLPPWPWILGIVLIPAIIGVVILASYFLAVLLVRMTRDRAPASMPTPLMLLGIAFSPLGVWLSARQERGRPIAWGVGTGAAGLLLGIVMIEWGIDFQMALFALGASLVALWFATTLRYFNIRERLVFTVTSFALIALWFVLPGGRLEFLLGDMAAGPEMFFVTGFVLVTCGTFVVVYNADILLPAVGSLGSRFGRVMPAIKTAIAYPLTSRFRTGLTIAMIGLIVFVLAMQSALNANFVRALSGDDARGGFDARVLVNGNNRIDNFRAALEEGNANSGSPTPADPDRVVAAGSVRVAAPFEVDIEDPEWKNKAEADRDPEDQFKAFTLLGVDDTFVSAQVLPLQYRAAGYATDHDVWNAIGTGRGNFAIIPATMTDPDATGFGDGQSGDDILDLPSRYTKDGFAPFVLNLRNRATGILTPVTVIGQMKESEGTFWQGMVLHEDIVVGAFPDAKGQQIFLELAEGTDANAYARSVESVLVQVQADSLQQLMDDNNSQARTFLELFQGFLGLGLLVGIAALGVISLRAVVERRQQIGMLRAIGYKRGMVQLSFLVEAGFIALSGIVIGLVLGLAFAANLFTSGEFGETSEGVGFTVPWAQIGIVAGVAFLAALLMTWLPARAASRVAVAEALRYE